MTPPTGDLVQVVGSASAGDPVTATALAWHAEAVGQGRPSRVLAVDPGRLAAVEPFDPSVTGDVIVHSVDGGADLAAALPSLDGSPITVVHHGSAPGSNRRALRTLRRCTVRALAADPAAREELRRLGFDRVSDVPASGRDVALAATVPDEATVENVARHPGAFVLSVGPVAPNRSVDALLDAFADVLTHTMPSAVLSLCGPTTPWYARQLHQEITRQGLRACEVVAPSDDAEVLARLQRADAVVALRPSGLDPYLVTAARRGVPIVAPADARTAWIDGGQLVPVAAPATRRSLAAALTAALS